MKKLFCLSLALIVSGAHAQTATKPEKTTPTVSATAPAQTEQQLATKLLELLNAEASALAMIDRPLVQLMEQSVAAMKSAVPSAQHEALTRELRADVKAVADELLPIVKASAAKAAPATIEKILMENFNKDELRQLIEYMESPLNKRFLALMPGLQAALNARVLKDTHATVTAKLTALSNTLSARIATARDAAAKTKR